MVNLPMTYIRKRQLCNYQVSSVKCDAKAKRIIYTLTNYFVGLPNIVVNVSHFGLVPEPLIMADTDEYYHHLTPRARKHIEILVGVMERDLKALINGG